MFPQDGEVPTFTCTPGSCHVACQGVRTLPHYDSGSPETEWGALRMATERGATGGRIAGIHRGPQRVTPERRPEERSGARGPAEGPSLYPAGTGEPQT